MDIYETANKMKIERKTIFDLNIRVTFYARVSTTRDEQENSIENQIAFFTDMIKNNKNWTYIEGYVDRIRGEHAENRTNFMRMIEDGKTGVFDLILTKEVSRFARNTIDSLTYTRDLLRAGVGVFFQNDNICTIDTDSELRLTIMSSIAADEVRKLSERVRWGHKRSIESGSVMGNNRIFGYDKKDCRLVINESEAEMVRLIFDLYSTGEYSTRKIENALFEKGYLGRNNNRIHHNTIAGIIQNPKYKGYFCGNKVKIVDYRTKEQRFLPPEEWIMYKDETGEQCPAIVSEELWDKCNAIFGERSMAIKSRERSFKDNSVFTGKIICAAHGKAYWRTSYSNSALQGKSVYQWICSEKKRFGAKSCASFSIKESELYKILSDFFKNAAGNIEDYVKTFLEVYAETDADNDIQKQINSLKIRLEKEKAKREKLLDLYTEGIIEKKEFSERNDTVNVLISELEENISALQNENLKTEDYVKEIRAIERYFKTMYSPDGDMTKEQVDEMTKAIIDHIDVVPINDDSMKLEIHLKTGLNSDITYSAGNRRSRCRSGHISKKMIDAYKQGIKS
ncbi:MAG: recombinase family protein [Ruminococcus sp.]|nr:recombinase family protein [Ruminococcus sp.]MCM1382483.1 recombinase family protein [Muribaculaceae bacterium]MCM1480492.1 recombinase family protein [Muribaculaceae bacterium]